MMDIVLAQGLPALEGITAAVPAQSLSNFRQPGSQNAAHADSRTKRAIIYSPSYELDDGVYKDAAKSGGAVVFSFSDVLKEKGFRRAIAISKMRLALSQCRKAGCDVIVCTLARDASGLRNARELSAFASVLGMNGAERKTAREAIERLVSG